MLLSFVVVFVGLQIFCTLAIKRFIRTNIMNYEGIDHPAGLFHARYNSFCSRYSISIKKVYYRNQKYMTRGIFRWPRRILAILLCTCSSTLLLFKSIAWYLHHTAKSFFKASEDTIERSISGEFLFAYATT